ncbi:MAG: molybdopterin-synthase adenylyltransferase MoeB [Acidimicrobiaceae bacterium]|nr:molybdopterin-synthase adenylyltransferase MoeB [Acidimicrobiaceae bacterium]
MTTANDLLSRVKADIREVSTTTAERLLSEGWLLLDVRESGEYEQGSIAGSVHIPRGLLELQVTSRVRDRSTPIVTMCAGGVRSAFAAATLAELGYVQVASMRGGFNQWKAEDRYQSPLCTFTADQRDRYARQQQATRVRSGELVLTADQRDRYARQLVIPEIGEEGQIKLLEARVLLLGVGGLGSPVALYLAAAGVGTLGVVDMDAVELSNLQRQVLHNSQSVGERKVDSAEQVISALNPDVNVITYKTRLRTENAADMMSGYDVVVDGSDNFESRYILSDAAAALGIPVVHGSVFRFEGLVTVFDPRKGTTFRDMTPEMPSSSLIPSCSQAGVLGVLPGIIGGLQASETLKLILQVGDSLVGRLLVFDALETSFTELELTEET